MSTGRPLPNHRAGIREVMLDANFTVLPVVSATRINYRADSITTFQRPDVDGFILRATNDAGVVKFSVHRFVPQFDTVTGVEEDGDILRRILIQLPEDLLSWLRDIVECKLSNLLPAGFGWDGKMTTVEYAKLRRVRDLFLATNPWNDTDKLWFDEMLTQAVKTSVRFLTTEWEKSQVLTGTLPIERHTPDGTVDIIMFDQSGARRRERLRRMIGANVPVVANFTVPKDVVRVIVVRGNCMLDENVTPYGVSLELYERGNL